MASAGRSSGGPYPNYIAGERTGHDLSQDDLAQASGIDRPLLSRIESGQVLCTPDQVDRVADALGVSAARLYDEAELESIGRARRRMREHAESEAGEQAPATTNRSAA